VDIRLGRIRFLFIGIDLATIKAFVFVDALFANNKDFSSQIGYMLVLANEKEVGINKTEILLREYHSLVINKIQTHCQEHFSIETICYDLWNRHNILDQYYSDSYYEATWFREVTYYRLYRLLLTLRMHGKAGFHKREKIND